MTPKRILAGLIAFACLAVAFDVALAGPRLSLVPAGAANPAVSLAPFATGFTEPVAIAFTSAPNDKRMFVVERAGVIRIVEANGTLRGTPFLDISSLVDSQDYGEMGLLGLAFEPNYATTGRFYVYYTTRLNPNVPAGGNILHLARYHVSADPNVADPAETPVLTIDHPDNPNHDGGDLHFGPDGYLYLGPGDGGSGGDPPNNAQSKNVLLGKLLRLNVTGQATYTIPASNPFTQTVNARGEIWAFGLRNPWRFSFDRQTGDLFIGDVGQGMWEEVDFQPAANGGGRNYGWRCYEGNHAYNTFGCQPQSAYVAAVAEYDHSNGNDAIIGGYVYRGSLYPSLNGYYFYGDNGGGNFWAMGTCSKKVTSLGKLVNGPSTFGEDPSGELYVASLSTGTVYHLVGLVASAPAPLPPLQPRLYLPLIQLSPACP